MASRPAAVAKTAKAATDGACSSSAKPTASSASSADLPKLAIVGLLLAASASFFLALRALSKSQQPSYKFDRTGPPLNISHAEASHRDELKAAGNFATEEEGNAYEYEQYEVNEEYPGKQAYTFVGKAQAPLQHEVLRTKTDDPTLRVAVLRDLLSPAEIEAVHKVVRQDRTVREIADREDDLDYVHKAYRIEHQLKHHFPAIYERLLQTAWSLDATLWTTLRHELTVYPEMEYLDYNVTELGRNGQIEAHTDNYSHVTMVVLLVDPEQFEGGVNHFEGDGGERDPRWTKLQQGDAVFFWGDKCMHWITPVTSGRRAVLQMELSSI
eukprot:TRINITY_DN37984_c0_g1_i1.p1 TRINITY_DN37984_c0_g1~~TRINITY_DN37984_c0_g1_i1.p1  ORF type:complete len:326 (-),score=61.54 TRINITY_DN37984_c0_g1_i1:572-1549(-)